MLSNLGEQAVLNKEIFAKPVVTPVMLMTLIIIRSLGIRNVGRK